MTKIEQHGSVLVVRTSGPLRSETISNLSELVAGKLSGRRPGVVLDLEKTPVVDGRALEWILALSDECSRRGGTLTLCNVVPLCADALRITGVGNQIEINADVVSAVGALS
ncbi:MAG: STAS domain-containing protein [Planctomycetota bacterium]